MTSVFDSDKSIVGTDYGMKCLKNGDTIYLQGNGRSKTYLKSDGKIGIPPYLQATDVPIFITTVDPDFQWIVSEICLPLVNAFFQVLSSLLQTLLAMFLKLEQLIQILSPLHIRLVAMRKSGRPLKTPLNNYVHDPYCSSKR